ncbi:MAG: hypothetical protein COU69_02905 [Candidatus Pacebacteria bacterium CG10_big_fil_rev_8_21_14_0_10_56_10]|nr:MAG: hypothetical protein COU69_02905 [Candidatus Pacebacteria bacterium CG10_big_fil_rev_8_21_14_0_10_56_10]
MTKSLTSALVTIRRSPYQALAAVLLLSLTFFVAYAFSLFLAGSQLVLQYFETRPQVIAFFELDTPAADINQAEQTIRTRPYVTETRVVTKEQALEIYKQENQEDPLLLELVTADILPASLEVSGTSVEDLPQIKTDLEGLGGIDEVVLEQDIVESLAAWTRSIRIIGFVSTAILGVASFLIMVVVIGMKVVNKRRAIGVMRIIGATKWFVRTPFVVEGMLYGLISSLIGWSLTFAGLLYLTPWLKDFLGPVPIFPVSPLVFVIQLSAGTLVGLVIGAFAGAVAVGRVMRQ